MAKTTVHHPLPLENLVRRLELSGFHVTPAMRLRMIQVLGSDPGKKLLKAPQKLKYILAPVVAQSPSEQEKFYLLFDHFLQEISEPPKWKMPAQQGFFLKNLWWILPLLFCTVLFTYLFWPAESSDSQAPSFPILDITGPTAAQPGDTLVFSLNIQNTSEVTLPVTWTLTDATNQRVERRENGDRTWVVLADAEYSSPVKLVSASVRIPGRDSSFTASTAFGIFCPNPPEFSDWTLPASLEVDEPFAFRPPSKFSENNYSFEWSFGDGTVSSERIPTHRYSTDGIYFLQLKITQKGTRAICSGEMVHRIAIGEENIFLEPIPPQFDLTYPRATWGWGAWLFLSILAISIFYYLVRWFKRPYPENEANNLFITGEITVPDKGPYSIPFRPLENLIPPEPAHYRLADMLRLRQEGVRREMDVPSSVNATIEAGGYPRLAYRTNTQPSDYLILVDRQSINSHQARFFQYLSSSLSRQDVIAEVFWFQTDPYRVWNAAHPNGVTLNMLARLYPDHRLIVMGDAHELLDPHAQSTPSLRQGTARVLKNWKQRLLITPIAPCSWTFREAILADVFVIFPADTEGLSRASRFIENGLEPGDLPPSFREWQTLLALERKDVDINYHNWRTTDDYKKYFAGQPQMLRWILALAVFPNPSWDITIAIGNALGIEPRFDRLLQLSRIPWLQNGDFHQGLRRKMLSELDPGDEVLARKAVKQELEAVASDAKEGFAAFELQSNLATQKFILAPYDPEAQKSVKDFLDAGVFNRIQVEELARSLPLPREQRPATKGMSQSMQMETPLPPNERLKKFLETQRGVHPPAQQSDNRPVFNPDFWRILSSAAAFVTMIVLMWNLDSSHWLYHTVFNSNPEPYLGQVDKKMRDYVLVKESVFIDSAALLNNEGTRRYFEAVLPELNDLIYRDSAYPMSSIPLALSSFKRAALIDPGNVLATENTAKIYYSTGAAIFNARRKGSAFLKKPIPSNLYQELKVFSANPLPSPFVSDSLALAFFSAAAKSREIQYDAQHGAGLAFYYLGKRDSASFYYNILQKEGYFDSLKLFPNLKILLGKQTTALFDIRLRNPNVRSVEVTFDYFINPKGFPKLRWELEANDNQGPSPFVRPEVTEAKFRRNTATLILQVPPSAQEFRTTSLRLRLRNPDFDSLLIDTLLYWPKNWNIQKIPGQNTMKSMTMDEHTLEMMPSSFSVIGQIVDSSNSQPLTGVKVKLLGSPRENPTAYQTETITDANGYYILKFEKIPSYRLKIEAERTGYQTTIIDLPPINPRLRDQQLPLIRLKQALRSGLQERDINLRKLRNTIN